MKKVLTSGIAATLILSACADNSEEETNNNNNSLNETAEEEINNVPDNNENDQENESNEPEPDEIELSLHEVEGYDGNFISAEELADSTDGSYEFDSTNKTLHMTVAGRDFYLVYNVPVLEIDGVYADTDKVRLVEDENGDPFVSEEIINKGLEADYSISKDEDFISFVWEDEVVEAWAPTGQEEVDIHEFTPEEMIEYISFLHKPIEGASVSTVESHLPGAPRNYRNGYHEGIDWYDYASGTEITTDTPIYAMAEGTVVRVDHDFEDYPSHEVRNEELDKAAEVGFTPEYILDRLRGKQVWVQYDKGVMNRFAHLDSIPDELELGQKVDEDTIIGYVGNTGTSSAIEGDGSGLHLHQDLLIYGELFWEPFTLEETADILRELWQ